MSAWLTALVAQSRPTFADVLLRLLCRELGVAHTATADSLEGAISAIMTMRPGLAVVDRNWPGADALPALVPVCDQWPRMRVVLTAAQFSPADVTRLRNMGARGCVPESAPAHEIVAALRVVLNGGTIFPDAAHQRRTVLRRVPKGRQTVPRVVEALTVRERQVLAYVGRGLTTKEIAAALNVSFKTADRHRANLMAKLDIHDRVQLALRAVKEGLVTL